MNIIDAIKHPKIFQPYLGNDLKTWRRWMTALRAVYGLPITTPRSRKLITRCTGRDANKLPKNGFDTALFLTGRRSGKSRVAAIIGAFEAILAGHERKLSKGEKGVVPIISPSKSQSRIVHGYLRSIFETPLLHNELVSDTKEGFELRNGTRIEILAGDWRTLRGFTLLAAIVDEACFFGVEAESKIKSDTELIRAIKPALATVNGKLIAISSPYAKRGWCYETWKTDRDNGGDALVWNCPSRTMNPTLSQSYIKRELSKDPAGARAEYLGHWRDDVAAFVPREVIEELVIKGRSTLLPQSEHRYIAFADVSGGRTDASALCIAHKEERTIIIDYARQWKAPHNPYQVIALMCEEMKRYGLRRITGDNYAAEFVASSFNAHGIRYEKSDKTASALYIELLPRLCSGEIELPDDETLITQLSSLERRTRSGGRDIIDHPHGGHDDLANAVAGACVVAANRRLVVGAF